MQLVGSRSSVKVEFRALAHGIPGRIWVERIWSIENFLFRAYESVMWLLIHNKHCKEPGSSWSTYALGDW